MRKPFIAGNWKMHKNIIEAITLANGIKRELVDFRGVDIILCPTFISLSSVHEVIMDTPVKLGAQDSFWQKEGAFTGEVSAAMLKDCGCEFVIVGHSERRKYFAENDEVVNKKIKAGLEENLTPIVCVGEVLSQRQDNLTIKVIKQQLSAGLVGLTAPEAEKIVIAYEPIWAIGTGRTATPAQAQDVHAFIRGWIKDNFSISVADNLRIIYGGSVKPANVKELICQEDIDGALVGGASLEVKSFVDIVNNVV